MSKISQRISCDDIVIRLTNPLDLHKLINFVNSNYYIKEGLLIGRIKDIKKDNLELEYIIEVTPEVDFNNLNYVGVIS